VNLKLAPLSRRLLAYLIDLVIFVLIGLLILVFLVFIFYLFWTPPVDFTPRDIENLHDFFRSLSGFASGILYFVIYQKRKNGQSVGKKILKIRTVRIDGQPIRYLDLLKRDLIGKTYLTLFLILGLLWMLEEKKRPLHDRITKTVVIDERT
jgi:uncharacterized RDD family membrane protein YckC